MDLNEAASLLTFSKEQARLAVEEGVETPRTRTRVWLTAAKFQHGYDIAQEALDAFLAAFESEEPGRHPPVAVRRTLLIESGYKCAVCRDNGPLEFHHMIEWSSIRHHDPLHMLAVCANCHGKITRYGEPDIAAQKQIKDGLRERQYGPQARRGVIEKVSVVEPAARLRSRTQAASPIGPFGTSDTTPPTLAAFEIPTQSVNVGSAPANVELLAHLLDDLSGVASTRYRSSQSQVRFSSPSGRQFVDAMFLADRNLISGTAQNGRYRTFLEISQFAEAGTWRVMYFLLVDECGNMARLSAPDLERDGFPTAFEVMG